MGPCEESFCLPAGATLPLNVEKQTHSILFRLSLRSDSLRAIMLEKDLGNHIEMHNVSVPGTSKVATTEHDNTTQRDHNNSGTASHVPVRISIHQHQTHPGGDDHGSQRRLVHQPNNHNRRAQTPQRFDGVANADKHTEDIVIGPHERPIWLRRHWKWSTFLLMLLLIPGMITPLAIHFRNGSNDKVSQVNTLVR
jgi:hypothetical protein